MFVLFAARISCKYPKASDMRQISSIPMMKCAINYPNLFPILRQIPVFFSLIWAIKESTSVYHQYCCGKSMLVHYAVFVCTFCTVTFMVLAAAPWGGGSIPGQLPWSRRSAKLVFEVDNGFNCLIMRYPTIPSMYELNKNSAVKNKNKII